MDIKDLTTQYDELLEKAENILDKMSALNKRDAYWFPSLHWYSNLHYSPGSYNEKDQTIGFRWTNSFNGCPSEDEWYDIPLKYFEEGFDLDGELQRLVEEKTKEIELKRQNEQKIAKQKKLETDRKTYELLKKQFEKE